MRPTDASRAAPSRARTRWARAGLAALLMVLAGASAPTAVMAQDDVVRLGRRYGTTPPDEYFQRLRTQPRAFQFSRGWMNRNPRLEVEGAAEETPRVRVREGESIIPPAAYGSVGSYSGAPASSLGRRGGRVEGTFAFPVLLGYFSDDSAAPGITQETVQVQFFDGPNDRSGTVADYYAEASAGAVQLEGVTQPWRQSTLSQLQVSGGTSGLGSNSQVGPFILTILAQADDGSIDWGQFDNDGPDGIPNSGDDDGFVDILAVVHPTSGAECSGARNQIWSHRWTLWSAAGEPYTTTTDAANGGKIRVDDYTIQPLLGCDGQELNDIGVFAHELGHGFGLPDLYCTGDGCYAAGIGEWGLMGSGGWGCDGEDPGQPCHFSAWSKMVMGWVDVETLPADSDLGTVTLDPVQSARRVLRYDIPGTDEFYLLENRDVAGFDQNLHGTGLLVWHVDQGVVDTGWPFNRVNADPGRYGVALVQADNLGGLEGTASLNRGDDGDPYPGRTGNTDFHAGAYPPSESHDGLASGLTLTGISVAGGQVSFQALTGFATVSLATEGAGAPGLLSVDGAPVDTDPGSVQAAPYQLLRVAAAPGEILEPGVRRPFVGWADGDAPAARTLRVGTADTALLARYEGRQVQVAMELQGSAYDVTPGAVVSDPASPGLWFAEGSAVTLTAEPTTGFSFVEWTGALAGAPNPVGLVVDAPVQAGAVFDYVFDARDPASLSLAAGDDVSVTLQAENANAPVLWTVVDGTPPAGLIVNGDRLQGSPVETGSFTFTVQARDALGLEGTAVVNVEVGVPEIPLETLAGATLRNGRAPSPGQAAYLDRNGNWDGRLDLGDIRLHLLRMNEVETVAPAASAVTDILELVRVGPGGGR